MRTESSYRRHRHNTDFAWTSCRDSSRELLLLTDAQARQWDDDGYFLLEGAFTPEEIATVASLTDPAEAALEAWLRAETDDGTAFIARADEITFTTHLVTRSPALATFTRHDVFRRLVHDVIGDDVRLYWDQAVYKKPHTTAPFPWHQDNGYAFVVPQQYLTCWIPLTDATLDNGCPWVLPGLHRMGTLHHDLTDLGFACFRPVEASGAPTGGSFDEPPDGDDGFDGGGDGGEREDSVDAARVSLRDAVPVEARVGDVVVFSSLTPHTTGANTTDHTRKSYIVQYAPDGAEVWHDDVGGLEQPPRRTPATHPTRQFPVLGCTG